MDHPLQPHREFPQRRWRSDGERFEEIARELHRASFMLPRRLDYAHLFAKLHF
jgi:hypothetical protein